MQTDNLIVVGVLVIIPIAIMTVIYLTSRLQTQVKLKAIEKGVPIPFEPVDAKERAARTRRGGIVLVALGLGWIIALLVAAWAERERDVLIGAALGMIPLFIGVGLLIDYRLRAKEPRESQPQ